MSRIAIVGPGAVGSVIAAWLHQTQRHEITLCARRPLKELHVETPAKTIVFTPRVSTDPALVGPAEWAIVTTKTYDATGAAAWLARLCASGAPAAILQNGVEHVERFAGYLPQEQIVPVMVDCPAERADPLHVTQRGTARILVRDDPLGRSFVRLFEGTDVCASVTDDFKSAIWRKLCLNSAGVISALALQPAGVMRDPEVTELSHALVRECVAVGRAEGAVLPDDLPETVLQSYRSAPPDSVNSLHADRAAGRPTEIDARNGAIVRLGRKHRIPTPCNEMAVALLTIMTRPASPR